MLRELLVRDRISFVEWNRSRELDTNFGNMDSHVRFLWHDLIGLRCHVR